MLVHSTAYDSGGYELPAKNLRPKLWYLVLLAPHHDTHRIPSIRVSHSSHTEYVFKSAFLHSRRRIHRHTLRWQPRRSDRTHRQERPPARQPHLPPRRPARELNLSETAFVTPVPKPEDATRAGGSRLAARLGLELGLGRLACAGSHRASRSRSAATRPSRPSPHTFFSPTRSSSRLLSRSCASRRAGLAPSSSGVRRQASDTRCASRRARP